MDKIEKIRQEIDRRHAYQKEMYSKTKPDGRPNDGWAESLAIMGELEELRDFIDSLSEETDKDLKKAAEEQARSFGYFKEDYEYKELVESFIAGAKWQEKRDEETIKTAEDHAFLAGADWQKEQMMKEAICGNVHPDDKEIWCNLDKFSKLKDGDKVRIIVLPKGDDK